MVDSRLQSRVASNLYATPSIPERVSTRDEAATPESVPDSSFSLSASVFLWEWFTTKPYADSGEVRFIGSVYSRSTIGLAGT